MIKRKLMYIASLSLFLLFGLVHIYVPAVHAQTQDCVCTVIDQLNPDCGTPTQCSNKGDWECVAWTCTTSGSTLSGSGSVTPVDLVAGSGTGSFLSEGDLIDIGNIQMGVGVRLIFIFMFLTLMWTILKTMFMKSYRKFRP